jgi:hypothetical protein
MIGLLLRVVALVLFVLIAFSPAGVAEGHRGFVMLTLGLAAWVLATICDRHLRNTP